MDEIKYGLIQLDSRLIRRGNAYVPEYPSIIVGSYKEDNNIPESTYLSIYGKTTNNWQKYKDDNINFLGTDLISFIRKYMDPTNIIKSIQEQAIADPSKGYEHTFTFYGYVPINIDTGEYLIDTNPWQIQITLYFRVRDGRSIVGIDIEIFDGENVKQLEDYFLTSIIEESNTTFEYFNRGYIKAFFSIIPPYTRDNDNTRSFRAIFSATRDDSKFSSSYNSSDIGTDSNFTNFYGITTTTLLSHFHNSYDTDYKNVIGNQDVIGDIINDDVPPPDLPTTSIIDCFHHMYLVDNTLLKRISNVLWSTDFTTNFLKIINNPIDSIVSISMSPSIPDVSENYFPIIVGNLPLLETDGENSSPITTRKLTSQYKTESFGEIVIPSIFATFQDYNIDFELYLPFISTVKLNTNEVIGSTLTLSYNIDYFTGNAVATLHIYNAKLGVNGVMYHWRGNILSNIPITGADYSQTILTGLNTVMNISNIGGNIGTMLSSLKPNINRGGNITGNAGALDIFTPYLIINIPNENIPELQNILKGKPLNISNTIYSGMGLIIADEIHIKGIEATEEEKNELENLFKSGVIL